jgi:putative ABC transport system ATP-binding protein
MPPQPVPQGSTPAALIELDRVSRRYGSGASAVVALDDVSLSLEAGVFAAFMGPSGSGKSTLLNIISGIDSVSSGSVRVAGRRIDRMGEDELARWRARNVGLVFQFFNLVPVLSAQENVALPLLLFDLPARERQARAALALGIVGLGHRLEHRPSQLSGGEQQRVAIARALVTDPDLVVADEPTGNLDARSAEAVLDLLRELRVRLGKTIVMVTHDPRALRWVDRSFHLDKGRLLAGDAAERAARALRAVADAASQAADAGAAVVRR